VIRSLREEQIEAIARIHLDVLPYTMNSQLGPRHLAWLYRTMAQDPASYVGVAFVDERTAGVISGSANSGALRASLLKQLSLGHLISIGLEMLLHPRRIIELRRSALIAAPVWFRSEQVIAELTAIAVDSEFRGHGIGRALVEALEAFFRQAQVRQYRLDTRLENEGAADFYRDLGFHEIGRRADSVVFVRSLG
jgi:ribosomal protein S18 acetylase RimI-like enzyme